MIAIGLGLTVLFAVALVFVAIALRSWGRGVAATETRLHAPGAHTLTYEVPLGQDPAVAMTALLHAGFTSVVDLTVGDHAGGAELLLVECDEQDRERVRGILAATSPSTRTE